MPQLFWILGLEGLNFTDLGDLTELDWTSIATYGALVLTAAAVIWTSLKNLIQFLWHKLDGIVGFVISTFVVFALWFSLLRIHVSISFNLDKEIFDDYLWLSALLFTPYYVLHYGLIKGLIIGLVRSMELMLDLLVFSWFPQKAEKNRDKWRTRVIALYNSAKDSLENFWQFGVKAIQESQMPFGINSPPPPEAEKIPKAEDSPGE
ncbi:hypothetical protein [Lyngbya confervoides]|uniref:Uncharacterized protein n=1 Tax=Lyngbya confervoides BDU141951 TaxID=1574623 RepID=A0ABD4T553_9CYAN|nr:hypothetical protein [Lyngbya confervoides]MCM1983647.1 hypothetical protein [Lyngbya confervoides BDU141951]